MCHWDILCSNTIFSTWNVIFFSVRHFINFHNTSFSHFSFTPYKLFKCEKRATEFKDGKKSSCVILFINYKLHGCICFITLSQIPSRLLIKTELCNHGPNHCNKLLNMARIWSAGRSRNRDWIRRHGFREIRSLICNKIQIFSLCTLLCPGKCRSVRKLPVIEFLYVSAALEHGTTDHEVQKYNKLKGDAFLHNILCKKKRKKEKRKITSVYTSTVEYLNLIGQKLSVNFL